MTFDPADYIPPSDFGGAMFTAKERGLFKSICSVVGCIAPGKQFKTFSDAVSALYFEGFINLPTNEDGKLLSRAAVEVENPLVDFMNFAVFTNDNRVVPNKALSNNKLLTALDSFPNVVQFVRDKAFTSAYRNCFVAMKSSLPVLKQYADVESIPGGIVMSTVIPEDHQFDGETTVMQLISLKLFACGRRNGVSTD